MYPKYQICLILGISSAKIYITQDIEKILDVQHLLDTFVVNSLNDVAPLKETAKLSCINVLHISQYNVFNTIIDVREKI